MGAGGASAAAGGAGGEFRDDGVRVELTVIAADHAEVERLLLKECSNREIFIHIGPVDADPVTDEPPVFPLLLRGVS